MNWILICESWDIIINVCIKIIIIADVYVIVILADLMICYWLN